MTYPPEPWSLRGRMHVTVWLLPVADVPPLPVPARIVRIGRRAVVGSAWVDYRPGGVLSYRELLAAVLVRDGWRPRVSITHIWVDSAASRDGGRALWGIPKDLAELSVTERAASAAGIASARLGRGRLHVRLPLRFTVLQSLDGRAKASPVRSGAHCGLSKVEWEIAGDGPLAFLNRGAAPTVPGRRRLPHAVRCPAAAGSRRALGGPSGRGIPTPSPASS